MQYSSLSFDGQDKAIVKIFHKLRKSQAFPPLQHSKDAYFCKPFVGWILAMTVWCCYTIGIHL